MPLSTLSSQSMSFFDELKRRNVIKVAVAYVVVAWLVMQFSDVILNNIEAPGWVFQVILLVLGVGFALTLFFAWAFELTPEGIKREHEVDRSQSITKQTGRKLDFRIIGVMGVALAYFVWEARFSGSTGPATSEPAGISQNTDLASDEPADIPTENSIAVLPFANRSMQQEDQFFTDGIHDDLLTQLAKIGDLRVISRTSMMKYRDTEKSIPEIGAELGVSTILEGGIQRAGKRIRINAQLIDVEKDQHIWAETFDREMTIENIFDIQSEITRQIVNAVRGELTEAETATLAQIPTNNLEAYEAYLQALALTHHPDYVQDNYIEAEIWLKKALELDPEYAHAWALLVVIHGQATWIGYDSSPERFAAAREAMENAKIFGPGFSETLAAEGEYLYRIENNYPASVDKFQAAHELAPGNAVQTDDSIDLYVRQTAKSTRHPSCTCRMGIDEETSVVDGEGRVHGVKRLRVVDASVMPSIASAALHAPTIMLAKKLVERIAGNTPLEPMMAEAAEALAQ